MIIVRINKSLSFDIVKKKTATKVEDEKMMFFYDHNHNNFVNYLITYIIL